MEQKFCPCCGRHCNLDSPNCGRGEEYLKTGVIPTHHSHERGEGGRKYRHEKYHSMDDNGKLIFNILDAGHVVRALYDGKASQNRILIILNESGAVTQSELTERLDVQSGTASEVIGKLERAGLIERIASEQDRRTCEIKLTDAGVKRAVEVKAERQQRHVEMFSCLTDEERRTLLSLMQKINVDWKHRYGHGKDGCHRHGEHHGRHGINRNDDAE